MSSKGLQQPPANYQCPYHNCCPHLQGLSTEFVFAEYQNSHWEHLDHWKARDELNELLEQMRGYTQELETQNAELKAKLTALHRRQFKANRKQPPATVPQPQRARKRGAPKGHPGWYRPQPAHIDQTRTVAAPDVCPHCHGTDLTPIAEIKEHLQEDIVLAPRTHVTCFKHQQAFCANCRRPVIESAEGEMLNCPIGPKTKALAVFLRYGMRVPYRKVEELFNVLFRMRFVPASAMGFDRAATRKGQPLYEDLKEKMRVAVTANADETSWRQDGITHYLWYAGNEDLALYHIDRHRSSEAAKLLLGEDFAGVLTTDGYAAYNAVNAKERQTCLAHLIRNCNEIKQEILLKAPRFQDPHALEFVDEVGSLFKNACAQGGKLRAGKISPATALGRRSGFYRKLDTICARTLCDQKALALQRRLTDADKDKPRLFTFLKYPNLQPTNNQAERSLRGMVIFRKISMGTRSHCGSHTHSVLPSLLLTAQRQGRHPLGFFETLFGSKTQTAQEALYNDSS
ncbi:MAG: IS66 family transposase [Deltaproteobacteria bacterium]|nr:MAG: IS66 family transposase [Deltaproteobacteria bacterium]